MGLIRIDIHLTAVELMGGESYLGDAEGSGDDEGAKEVVAAVAAGFEDGNLRPGDDDRFAQILQHEGQRRCRVRQRVSAVQDHEAVERVVPFLRAGGNFPNHFPILFQRVWFSLPSNPWRCSSSHPWSCWTSRAGASTRRWCTGCASLRAPEMAAPAAPSSYWPLRTAPWRIVRRACAAPRGSSSPARWASEQALTVAKKKTKQMKRVISPASLPRNNFTTQIRMDRQSIGSCSLASV